MDAEPEQVPEEAGGGGEPPVKVAPEPPPEPDVVLVEDGFGFLDGKRSGFPRKKFSEVEGEAEVPWSASRELNIVRRYTWRTKNRMMAQVISYGATITAISVPDRKGVPDDVLAGFDNIHGYRCPNNPYMGATIGRYANYIRNGTMYVKPSGRLYMLSCNKDGHHYHGGFLGFDKVNWRSYMKDNTVIMSYVSESQSEGFPGTLMVQITFEVTCNNTLKIDMRATTSEPTIINLSNQPFFNLAGHHAGAEELFTHIVTINGDKYTSVDIDGNVEGFKKPVGGTPYDFRVPRILRTMVPKMPCGGYDINYCITQGVDQDLTFVARVLHPSSGRVLEVYSNQPGVQFYTGNDLPDPNKIIEDVIREDTYAAFDDVQGSVEEEGYEMTEERNAEEKEEKKGVEAPKYVPLVGKRGVHYTKNSLLSFQTQNYPDAVNHINFPSPVLNPGETYRHSIEYKFGILLGKYT